MEVRPRARRQTLTYRYFTTAAPAEIEITVALYRTGILESNSKAAL
jgi:hypothetical protein